MTIKTGFEDLDHQLLTYNDIYQIIEIYGKAGVYKDSLVGQIIAKSMIEKSIRNV